MRVEAGWIDEPLVLVSMLAVLLFQDREQGVQVAVISNQVAPMRLVKLFLSDLVFRLLLVFFYVKTQKRRPNKIGQ